MSQINTNQEEKPNWRENGVKIVRANQLDPNTPQTIGMLRKAAVSADTVGSQKIWAGTVSIEPNARTGYHHHGDLESVIYVVKGKARLRWGEKLEFVGEAGPGDFIFVPPYVPHQEINANPEESLECVLVRSDNEAIVVNLNIDGVVDNPETVYWVDPIHKKPCTTTHSHDGHSHDHSHDGHNHSHDHSHDGHNHSHDTEHSGHHQNHPNLHDMCDNSHAHH